MEASPSSTRRKDARAREVVFHISSFRIGRIKLYILQGLQYTGAFAWHGR